MKKQSQKEETRNLETKALIENNLGLVKKIAGDFVGRGLPFDDLVSEGSLGLMKAARRYDPRRGAKFSTFSGWWIKQAIRLAVAQQGRTVRVPIGALQKSSRIWRCEQELAADLGREPSDGEVAQAAGLPPVTVRRLRKKRLVVMQSLNDIIPDSDQDGPELGDFFADESAPAPDQALGKADDIGQLRALLGTLSGRERYVLERRFGLGGKAVQTLEEVGRQLHCTNERVRQIQNQALRKLRGRLVEDEKRTPA